MALERFDVFFFLFAFWYCERSLVEDASRSRERRTSRCCSVVTDQARLSALEHLQNLFLIRKSSLRQ